LSGTRTTPRRPTPRTPDRTTQRGRKAPAAHQPRAGTFGTAGDGARAWSREAAPAHRRPRYCSALLAVRV
jgi:hypothetical protein